MAAMEVTADDLQWRYMDKKGVEWGPFSNSQMRSWFEADVFKVGAHLLIRLETWDQCEPIYDLFPALPPFAFLPSTAQPVEAPLAAPRWTIPGFEPHAKRAKREAAVDDDDGPRPPPGRPPPAGWEASGWEASGYAAARWPQGCSYGGKGDDGRYFGRIKTYSSINGFGFIDCPAAAESFGRDVFVDRKSIGEHQEGDQVSFLIEVVSNMPRAKEIGPIDYYDFAPASDARFTGIINHFNNEKGFGFVQVEGSQRVWQKDVFIHKDHMHDVDVGNRISFTIEMKTGRPQARNIGPVDGTEQTLIVNGVPNVSRMASQAPKASSGKKRRHNAGPCGKATVPGKATAPTMPLRDRTTLLLRHLPRSCTRADLLEALDGLGLNGQYDFIYLPISFRYAAACGYAFVNMTSHDSALAAMEQLRGWEGLMTADHEKRIEVDWSTEQGLKEHVERFKDSPVMHESVPEEYRPLIFRRGSVFPFPPSKSALKPPRMRGANKEEDPDDQAEAPASDDGDADPIRDAYMSHPSITAGDDGNF